MAGDVHPLHPADAELQGEGDDAAGLGLPAEVLTILNELQADYERNDGAPLSLARLSKRTQLRMSTLRRFLSALEEAGVVKVELNEDGTGRAQLLMPSSGG
ncbi:helix-turn-helix domain-containing protein [Herbaspirillum sp. LeCh32-8]|uniref:helix-turn-helix domain-containing protein n=1 Tax=Herbaspirillum sp. LeCh32-8 TaxID=2821356 RepID=UPI001AE9448D|nr:helix-turn-helix domain-containing protein [Herbaspirillum sp. LeCh32-8]MBP0600136.1 helix-turn-helix domain-containing protein [Herbaspirillum sp. LeCh32-8]